MVGLLVPPAVPYPHQGWLIIFSAKSVCLFVCPLLSQRPRLPPTRSYWWCTVACHATLGSGWSTSATSISARNPRRRPPWFGTRATTCRSFLPMGLGSGWGFGEMQCLNSVLHFHYIGFEITPEHGMVGIIGYCGFLRCIVLF